jgi:hypothetical protein
MKVLIREGSAAKNFEALIPLLNHYPEQMMFCSDDKHPDSLVEGHINVLCARAAAKGIPVFNILQAACINPVLHYGLMWVAARRRSGRFYFGARPGFFRIGKPISMAQCVAETETGIYKCDAGVNRDQPF